jgi:hypothetical protein
VWRAIASAEPHDTAPLDARGDVRLGRPMHIFMPFFYVSPGVKIEGL